MSSADEATPPDVIVCVPPRIVAEVSVPATVSNPPGVNNVQLAWPPALTLSVLPAPTVVLVAKPPDDTISDPLASVERVVCPPDMTVCVDPEIVLPIVAPSTISPAVIVALVSVIPALTTACASASVASHG